MRFTVPEIPPPWPHGWPSCAPSAPLPLMVLPVIVSVPSLSIPPPNQIDMVTCNYTIGNRHRSKVEYAATSADRELIRHTGDVIAHNAVGDHHCADIVV